MLKKISLGLLLSIALIAVLCYIALFTQVGKFFVKPLVQKYITNHYSRDLTLLDFNLGFNSIDANFDYKNFLDLNLKGSHHLIQQTFNLKISGKSKSVRKKFTLDGNISGDFKDFNIKIFSDIASSRSNFFANIQKLQLAKIYFKSQNLVLEELPPFFDLENQFNGRANILIKIQKGNEGNFLLDLSNIYITKKTHFQFLDTLIKKRFHGKLKGDISLNGTLLAQGVLHSDIYTINIKNLNLMQDQLSFHYNFQLPSVANINPKIKKDFHILANGQANYNLKNRQWDVDLDTTSFEGELQAFLHKNHISIIFSENNLNKILYFTKIPQNIHANLTGTLNYSLIDHEGTLEGEIDHFTINRNTFLDLIRQYTKFDIQKEIFDPMPLKINIQNQQAILHDMNLQSTNLGFSTSLITLDFEKMFLETLLKMRVKNSILNMKISGNINNLHTKFNLNDILRLDRK
ncbi:hypothetical protein [Helicobacter anatolicus]|uniref:hypothetical protein n=1 Tax=Helicobacter anatolicus TaxID=2905874 RepID=UPI001E2C6666|nr:hypothetical protein [Helicobacter anatolicus]MCE3038933.1 hypothetical protein [Helicobacter anatolicus]